MGKTRDLFKKIRDTKGTFHARSVVSDSASLWAVALQAPLSVGFSRQECWSGLSCPSPGDLPDPGIEPTSLVSPASAGGFFTTEPPEKSQAPCS